MSEGEAPRRRVVIVEDDGDIASLLTDILDTEGYAPVAVGEASRLVDELEPRPALIVLDLRLRRGSADEILATLRDRGMGDVPILLLSAATDLAERARALGIPSFLAKPFELDELLVAVRRLI